LNNCLWLLITEFAIPDFACNPYSAVLLWMIQSWLFLDHYQDTKLFKIPPWWNRLWFCFLTSLPLAMLCLHVGQPIYTSTHSTSGSPIPSLLLQEGQHPLTGTRAANFRLLANQWAERRLVTQWCHRCRAVRRNVCNAGASNEGRSLCLQILRERSYPPANILIPLERQLVTLQLCRWQFLYNETLQQTSSRPLLSKLIWKTTNLGIWSPFWGSYGRRKTLADGSLESPYTTSYSPQLNFFR